MVIFSSDFIVENIIHISSGDRICAGAEAYSHARIYITFSVIHIVVFANIHIPLNKALTFLGSSFMV